MGGRARWMREPQGAGGHHPEPMGHGVTNGRTILVVEDDVAFADFIRACVESLGHRAVVINDGALALAAFEEEQPDLVLLDLLLPRRDGFMICDDIRNHPRGADVPVVMMT